MGHQYSEMPKQAWVKPKEAPYQQIKKLAEYILFEEKDLLHHTLVLSACFLFSLCKNQVPSLSYIHTVYALRRYTTWQANREELCSFPFQS